MAYLADFFQHKHFVKEVRLLSIDKVNVKALQIEHLLADQRYPFKMMPDFSFNDFQKLLRLKHALPCVKIAKNDVDLFLSFLCFLGYLTIRTVEEGQTKEDRLRIPNAELRFA